MENEIGGRTKPESEVIAMPGSKGVVGVFVYATLNMYVDSRFEPSVVVGVRLVDCITWSSVLERIGRSIDQMFVLIR